MLALGSRRLRAALCRWRAASSRVPAPQICPGLKTFAAVFARPGRAPACCSPAGSASPWSPWPPPSMAVRALSAAAARGADPMRGQRPAAGVQRRDRPAGDAPRPCHRRGRGPGQAGAFGRPRARAASGSTDLLRLLAELQREDPPSVPLLEAYLDRRVPGLARADEAGRRRRRRPPAHGRAHRAGDPGPGAGCRGGRDQGCAPRADGATASGPWRQLLPGRPAQSGARLPAEPALIAASTRKRGDCWRSSKSSSPRRRAVPGYDRRSNVLLGGSNMRTKPMRRRAFLATLGGAANITAMQAWAGAPDEHASEKLSFRVVEVAGGLAKPWGLAFLPSGAALVTEPKARRLRLIGDGGADEVSFAGDWLEGGWHRRCRNTSALRRQRHRVRYPHGRE